MMNYKNFTLLLLGAFFLCSCTSNKDVYGEDDFANFDFDTYADTPYVPEEYSEGDMAAYSQSGDAYVNAAGVKYCPPQVRCPDEGRLPPQPCAQPMPTYYGNVTSDSVSDGIVLIHPYTRTKVICFDKINQSAEQCAQNFKASGYVLVTDLPQLPARYDLLKEGTYPSRRWRDGGEVVPRW